MRKIWKEIEAGNEWIVDADLKDFFGSACHQKVLTLFGQRIADGRILSLLDSTMKAGCIAEGKKLPTDRGMVEPHFHPDSYGYRLGKSAHDALGMTRQRCWRYDWCVDLDIKGFFDNLDHEFVMRAVRKHTDSKWILLYEAIKQRLLECKLELHPEKTRIVYCKDDDQRGTHENEKFDFLGYTFRARRSKNRHGKYFVNFSPAVSNKAAKAMRQKMRSWGLQLRSDKNIEDLGRMFYSTINGWINYYGRYYKSALYPVFQHLNRPSSLVGNEEI